MTETERLADALEVAITVIVVQETEILRERVRKLEEDLAAYKEYAAIRFMDGGRY